jgi:muramidase (phage lysozyme)
MDTNVLKEFLVKVGFSVDRGGLRALAEGLKGATGAVEGLAKAAIGMAGAVTAAVTVTARQLDTLYYSAQRADSTAESLMAVGHAARSIGLTASGVRGQIEGFAASLRDMPPMRSWLAGITGVRGTPEQMFEGFAKYYARMQAAGRELMARMVLRAGGLDPEQIRQMAMNLPAFLRSREEMSAWFRALGFNANQATSASALFIRELNRSWGIFTSIWDKLTVALLPILQRGLKSLNDLVVEHMGDIREFVDGPLSDFVRYLSDPKIWADWQTSISSAVTTVKEEFKNLDQTVRDFSDTLKSLYEHRQAIGLGILALGVGLKNPALIAVGAGLVGSGPLPGEAAYKAAPPSESKTNALGQEPWGQQLWRWLTEQTHSPNVEIYEARGLWGSMRAWLGGSQSTVPLVNLSDAAVQKLKEALSQGGDGSGGGARGIQGLRGHNAYGRRERFGLGTSGRAVSNDVADKNLPPEAKALLNAIAGPESGGAYNARWKGKTFSDMSKHPQIYEPGPEGPSSAAGRYQIVWNTFKGLIGRLRSSSFDPEHQDRAAWELAKQTFGPGLIDALKAGRYDEVSRRLHGQWNTLRAGNISREMEKARKNVAEAAAGTTTGAATTSTGSSHLPVMSRDYVFGKGKGRDVDPAHGKYWVDPKQAEADRLFPRTSFEPRVNPYAAQLASATTNEGDRNVTIAPTTHVTVHADDAKAAGRYVADAQERVTARMVRAFQPVAG